MIVINEERGVAAFPYNEVIDDIVEWVSRKILRDKTRSKKIHLEIPKSLTKKITFIQELFLDVYVTNESKNDYTENNVGEGKCGDNSRVRLLRNKKMEYADIDIYSFSYDRTLDKKTLYSPLYHELHHAYESWLDLIKNGNTKHSNNLGWKSNFRAYDIKDFDIQSALSMICYQLHSENEFNALTSDVYGELKGMNSTRENFRQDIKQTWAYKTYVRVKNDLPKIIKYLKNNKQEAKSFFDSFEYRGGKFNPYNRSVDGYIDEFNRKTKFLLNKLIKNIGRSASLYYDTIENNNNVSENIVSLTINDLRDIIAENLSKINA